MEYTKRIGFLVGPYMQIAAPTRYVNEINKIVNLDEQLIEMRKKFICKRDI